MDGYIAVADFGLAKLLDHNAEATTFCGTQEYIAPEIIASMAYSYHSDWWSFGVFIYENLFGAPPFSNSNASMLQGLILKKELTFPDYVKAGIKISNDAIDIMRKLLVKDPKKRLGTQKDSDEIMAHPFFSSVDIASLMSKKIKPAYVPYVPKGKYDLSNFNAKLPIKPSTLQENDLALIEKNKDKFKDFDI